MQPVTIGFQDVLQEERDVGPPHYQHVHHILEMLHLVVHMLALMEIVILQQEQQIAKPDYAQMPRQPLPLMLTALCIKRDASPQEKDVYKQLFSLNAQLIKEIIPPVLDTLDQMVFVKEMLEVHNVEPENVKMQQTLMQQTLIVENIRLDAKQQERDVLPH
jgi:hypothetical protein